MKKRLTLLVLILSFNLSAQAPGKMSYQAVVRNSDNQLVQNGTIGLKVSILQGLPSGTAVYVETQAPLTNGNGLFSIEVGNGTVVSGIFNAIDWKTGPYWMQTEVDPLGGADYSITAVSQLLSVPYALHSNYSGLSGNGIETVNDNGDGTLTFEFTNGTNYTSPVLTGLQGPAGADGQNGSNGTNGQDGVDGVSVLSTQIQNDSLYVSLSNGQTINAGFLYNNSDDFDFFFPEGKNGQSVMIFPNSNYTVPLGKTLYFTYGYSDNLNNVLKINSDTLFINGRGALPELTNMIVDAGCFFNGILVNKNLEIIHWNTNSPYTVPLGKQFYLLSARHEYNGPLHVNGVSMGSTNSGGNLPVLIFPSGTILSWQNSYQNRQWIFTGYLK